MAKDYSANLATAKRLIRKFGRQVTLVQIEKTSSDGTKPWRTNDAPRADPADSTSLFGVPVPPTGAASLGFRAEQNDLLKTFEQIFILEPGEDDPEDLDKFHVITDGGVDYNIKYLERLKPGDTTLLYFVGVAR